MSRLIKLWFAAICLLSFTALSIYGFLFEPYQVQVNEYTVKKLCLNSVLKGKTVVHITDLHIDKIGRIEKQVLKIIDAVKPDITFITGDMVKWKGSNGPAIAFLNQLSADHRVWAVMGDYDYSNSRKSCLFCHEPDSGSTTKQHQVKFLRNHDVSVAVDGVPIRVGGIDGHDRDSVGFNEIWNKWGENPPDIILSHDPLMFEKMGKSWNSLMLAGDTHGGQIRMPSLFWRLVGYEKNEKYNYGLFRDGEKQMIVSAGIGTSHMAFRFLSPPEVVVLRF